MLGLNYKEQDFHGFPMEMHHCNISIENSVFHGVSLNFHNTL